jgi:hypothetical protein
VIDISENEFDEILNDLSGNKNKQEKKNMEEPAENL